ncbi:tRNA pseudouridine(38-40) synthase TruA [Candidatus Nitrotoga sp. 1052]|uniref:tRNA pseudouridine(38-40) synthase TruA n=1 Tax=Candidatus Nitrotoga sp. 1052 TaxID=2886964 RepID=UPI001EF6C904|nr:tRNA pseudouridine(38-40) synthase TruA [Candidatus Nitrotoga sp. 1052]CAH1070326.1 tRNA pseudouridine(38-40) synthase [Candidatus Nitrotoga sp. 1052]
MRIALGVEYDGSQYFGWQSQAGGHTVQDALQAALSGIANELISVVAAGRTDTGVHAQEQVVHFNTNVARPLTAWVRGVNALLPNSIAVLWAHTVPEEFHARFSAQARSYRYLLINRSVRNAMQHGKAGWFHAPLNVEKMCEAAQYLLGEHDFSALRAAECQAKSPIKNLAQLDIQKQGDTIIFDLSANAFLHHMVRNIVGCLVYIGKGKHPPQWMREVLEGQERSLAAPTFAPDGLYLRRITYDAKWDLPQLK